MSRSRSDRSQNKRQRGQEYWKSRLHRHGETPGRDTKTATHRLERRVRSRRVIAEQLADYAGARTPRFRCRNRRPMSFEKMMRRVELGEWLASVREPDRE